MPPYVKHRRTYVDEKTGRAASSAVIEKIRAVYVPPGYKDVRFHLTDKLLATGVDTKGRTQYIYSHEHKQARTNKRKATVQKVAKVIKRVEDFMSESGDECALILRLIKLCNFRIGSDDSCRKYKHYGLTTLTPQHFHFGPRSCKISFIGKKGVHNESVVQCPTTVKQLKRLVRETSKNENVFEATASDVNGCLSSFDITTKDLRTYYANITFLERAAVTKDVKQALEQTAQFFHNTKTVLKNSYVVPEVYEWVKDGNVPKSARHVPKTLLHILSTP
jgi:DNA topoisomerase-1